MLSLPPFGSGRSAPAPKRGKKKVEPLQPRAAWAGIRLLGLAALGVGAVLGWRGLEAGLLAHAREHHGGAVGHADVVLQEAPPWVAERPELADRLRAAVAEVVPADPFDGSGLASAAERLAGEPWVAEVTQVRRTPAGIEVEAEYREPLALVRARDGYHVVDAAGRRLEGPADRHFVGGSLPVIDGVTTPPPAEAGRVWSGAEMAAGLGLVQRLRHEPFAPQIAAYDVGQRDPRTGRLQLVLHTDSGSVVWGRPVNAPFSAAEVSDEEKLSRLHQLAAAYRGRIDAGGRVLRIYGERVQVDQRPGASRTVGGPGSSGGAVPAGGGSGDGRSPVGATAAYRLQR